MILKDLTLEITRKCPMKCVLCSSNGGEPLPNEFSLGELEDIINQAKSMGVAEISLSGGEPLTYPHIIDICEYITKLSIDIFIYTSGNVFGKSEHVSPVSKSYFLKLKTAGVKKIVFSLYGSNPQIHDNITGMPKSFENLMESIKNAQRAYLTIDIHFVPVRENFRDLPAIVSLVKKIGLKSIHILRFVPQGRGAQYKDRLDLRPEEVLELREILNELTNKSDITIDVGAHYNDLGLVSGTHCTAGMGKAAIRPDGFVFPCVGMKWIKSFMNHNNVKDNRLKYIVNESYGFTVSRDILSKGGPCRYCTGDCGHNNGCIAQWFIRSEIDTIDRSHREAD